MKIESVNISDLVLDPENARKHSEPNLRAIGASLREFGQRKPIVVTEDNVVIAGNGTVQAAQDLGWSEINIVRIPADWSEDRIRAFAVADNRIAELSEWNVPELFTDLSGMNIELLEATGFTLEDIEDYGALLEEQTAPASAGSKSQSENGIDSDTQIQQNETYAEFLERYASRATRNVLLQYSAAEYAWVNEQFAEYRNRNGMDSNSEAVKKMLAEANEVEMFEVL